MIDFLVNPGLTLFTWISFGIVLFILVKFGWGPVLRAINQREESIEENVSEARHQREKAESLLHERQEQLDEAHAEARDIINQAREKGESRREEIVEEARQKRESMIESAEREIEAEREQALESLQGQVGELSLELARHILKREIDESTHRSLVSDFMSELEQKELAES